MSYDSSLIEDSVDVDWMAQRMIKALASVDSEKRLYIFGSFLDHARAAELKPSETFVQAFNKAHVYYLDRLPMSELDTTL